MAFRRHGFLVMNDTKNASKAKNSTASKKDRAAANTAVATKNKKDLQVAAAKKGEIKKVDSKKAVKAESHPFDMVLWLLSLVLIVAAIGGNYYYTRYMMIDETSLARLGRVAIVIVTIVAGLAVLLFTSKGRKMLAFGRDSYTELRKVVWPTRNEAMQTTFIVFVTVCIVSLFLYLCDLVFLQIVRIITI